MKKTRCHPTKGDTVFCLVGDYAISENFIIANRVLIDAAAIAGVALDGVDNAVFDFLDNTGVVGLSILRTRRTFVIPIKENNHSGDRLGRTVDPLSTIFEPLDTVHAACIFGYNTGIDVSAFICAPTDEAGAPLHAAAEAVP